MKSEHIKIFSYLTKSYTLQKDEVEALRGILVADLVNNKGKLADLETAEVAKKLISKYNISLSMINFYSELLNNLKLDGKVLFVASEEAENLYMATRNLNNVLVLFPDEINVYDILNADYVVFDEASIKMVEEALK